MSQLILMIGRIDDLDNPEALTEVWRRAMPVVELSRMRPEHYLNGLENDVMEVGWEAMRTLMVEQWRLTDELLVRCFRQEHAGATVGDGYDRLKVASRLGVVHLPRQVCDLPGADRHSLPGNAGLAEHEGQVTTRGLQEGVSLLPQELPFGTVERLVGWMAHDPEVMSETQSRRWVGRHGEIIRQAERAEVKALQKRPDLNGLKAQLQEAGEPRRPAVWAAVWASLPMMSAEPNQAVETALAQANPQPPAGVRAADWERVLAVKRTDPLAQADDLRRLGPEVQAGEVLARVDEIVVRRPEKRRFLELGTAFVRTASGYRYLSGSIERVVQQLFLLLSLRGSLQTQITWLGDGARWISRFFQERLAAWPLATLLLDGYHCPKKCYDLTRLIGRGRQATAELLGWLLKHVWRGQVQEAIAILEQYRPPAKNLEKLNELINYLKNRQAYIPNYRERRAQRHYIGSAHVEKGNDLIVARRQKHHGMQWSEQTSDALAALRTLLLNGGWDLYWQKHQVLPLAIQVST
jgi:hypothetical protein